MHLPLRSRWRFPAPSKGPEANLPGQGFPPPSPWADLSGERFLPLDPEGPLTHALTLDRRFFKAHGHGNDYLVFEEGQDWLLTPDAVRAVCHRNRGVGADGVVVLLDPRAPAPPGEPAGRRSPGRFRTRMFNPDGSEFERSGNGLRILGSYLLHGGWVEVGRPFPVEVGGEVVRMEILARTPGGEVEVAVEMGKAVFPTVAEEGGAAVQEGIGPGTAPRQSLPGPAGERLEVQPVRVGNPHCVVFRETLREEDLLVLGPFLVRHPAFPQGTNVQLAQVVGEDEVAILIWERGVGRTSSSGTSACAVAAAAVATGRLRPGTVRVRMEGGEFRVVVSPELEVRLEGPVAPVMTGELAPEWRTAFAP